ncbi:MAG: hypothetical protein JXA30_20565 [Deltaproteobacteria bacterium]|nr:hypothetical protein [Deltaproteobacteria bacterium]
MEQISTKSASQNESFSLTCEKIKSEPRVSVRENECGVDRIDRITRRLVHDVNNHLSVIINYTHVLARLLKNDNQLSSYVQEMRTAAWRASRVARQLSVSKEKSVDEPQVQNINFAIQAIAPLLRNIIGEAIALKTNLAPDLWSIKISVSQIEQVLINLAVNGRDQMAGEGTLTIETSNFEIKENQSNTPFEVRFGPYIRLKVSYSVRLTGERSSEIKVRDQSSERALNSGMSLGHRIVLDTTSRVGGYLFQLSDNYGGTTNTIFFPACKDIA